MTRLTYMSLTLAALFAVAPLLRADIYRYDDGQVIPGTEGIDPVPGVQLDHRDLPYAALNGIDLTGASFQASNLANASLYDSTLTDANLSGANLSSVAMEGSTLTNANLAGAVVAGTSFDYSIGLTKEQIYSTASYQHRQLQRIQLSLIDLTNWDFSMQDLSRAHFVSSTLTGANLTGAIVAGARFEFTTGSGFTKEQLYSTASYQQNDLQGIELDTNDLTGWDFSGQNLAHARMHYSTLTNSNLTGAIVTGVTFNDTTSRGFTKEQLYSTASYQQYDLKGIILIENDLTDWDLSGQNLNNAVIENATLTNTNLSGADLRGIFEEVSLAGAILSNTVRPDGTIGGLTLTAGDRLVIRDDDAFADYGPPRMPIPVRVRNHVALSDGGRLQLILDADAWNSTISFGPAIPVSLGGTLELSIAADVDVAGQVGRTFDVFDWTGVNPTGQFQVDSPYAWDLSNLYTTGEVTLIAVPEPSSATLVIIGVTLGAALRCRRRRFR